MLDGRRLFKAVYRRGLEANLVGGTIAFVYLSFVAPPQPPPPHGEQFLYLAVAPAYFVIAALAALVIVGGGILVARSVYFLGAGQDGNVALYRGLPYDLPLGIALYSKQYSIPVQVGTLSEVRQAGVTEHELRGKDDATDFISDIEQNPTQGLPPPPAPPPKKKKRAGDAAKAQQAPKR